MFRSIRAQLLITFVILAASPLLLVGSLLAYQAFTRQQQDALTIQSQKAAVVSTQVESFISGLTTQLDTIVHVEDLIGLSPDGQKNFLNVVLSNENSFVELTLLDSTGKEIARVSRLNTVTAADLADRSKSDEFLSPISTGKTYYGPVQVDPIYSEPWMTLAVPIVEPRLGKVQGVLVSRIQFKAIWLLVRQLSGNGRDIVYILDASKRVVAHPNPSVVLRATQFNAPLGNGIQQGLTEAAVVLGTAQIQFGDQVFTVVSEQPAVDALALAVDAVRVTVVVILIAIALAVIAGVLMIRLIVRPIQSLAATAHAIAAGDLSRQAKVVTPDELGEMASAFNSMTAQLRQTLEGLQSHVAELERAKIERRRAEIAIEQLNRDLEQRVRDRTAELEAANAEITTFAYIVSHDLRAPLVNLKGFAAELHIALNDVEVGCNQALPHIDASRRDAMVQALQENIPEALQYIESSVSRIDDLTNAVLKLSRLGRQQLQFIEVDVRSIVEKTLSTLAYQIKERHVQVAIGNLPSVTADRVSMEQIFGNILTNAVAYLLPERPGYIEISGERLEDKTTFRIRDNGRGISPDDMKIVFAPFRRAGKQDVPGEGMGLAYVQTLVRRHGGHIWCESELGEGTTFMFTISAPRTGSES